MSEKNILLGKRRFVFHREETVEMGGWIFEMPQGFRLVAGGSENPAQTMISLYRETEKVAQLSLTYQRCECELTVHAVASEVMLNISLSTRAVTLTEK